LRERFESGRGSGIIDRMARCTAPVRGHRSERSRAECPACGGYGRYSGYSSYGAYSFPSYSSSGSSGGGSRGSARPRWSPAGSSVAYTPGEVRTLTPVRQSLEARAPLPDPRDVFLCHAWDDRGGAAKDLHDLLVSRSVTVAKRTSPSARPCSAKSTRDWRGRELGSCW
jgi:hypothetical protein